MAGRGGKRPGAGRKSNAERLMRRDALLAGMDDAERATFFDRERQTETWVELLNSRSERVRLNALIYLANRAYGRPRPNVSSKINVRSRINVPMVGARDWEEHDVAS